MLGIFLKSTDLFVAVYAWSAGRACLLRCESNRDNPALSLCCCARAADVTWRGCDEAESRVLAAAASRCSLQCRKEHVCFAPQLLVPFPRSLPQLPTGSGAFGSPACVRCVRLDATPAKLSGYLRSFNSQRLVNARPGLPENGQHRRCTLGGWCKGSELPVLPVLPPC